MYGNSRHCLKGGVLGILGRAPDNWSQLSEAQPSRDQLSEAKLFGAQNAKNQRRGKGSDHTWIFFVDSKVLFAFILPERGGV